MKCIIITIGDEILAGKTVDSNSSWLSKELGSKGIETIKAFTVPDDIDVIANTISDSLSSANIVLTTGGLGPTDDDMTREAIEKALSAVLTFDENYFAKIKDIFADRGIAMPENVRREAYVPEGARILPNSVGVAPGLLLERDGKFLIALPGVPPEMKDIFENQLLPVLSSMGDVETKRVEVFYTTGLPESAMFEKLTSALGDLDTAGIGSYPGNLGVEIRMTMNPDDISAEEKLRIIEETLAPWIYSTNEKSLPAVIGKILESRGKTLACAESCTGGLLASRIIDVPGASGWFMGSAVTYSNESKAEILGVSKDDIETYGAVSAEVAGQMAEGAAKRYRTDYAMSTTGIAGPSGGTPEKPVGTVFYALRTPERILVRKNRFTRGRKDHRYRTSQAALAMLWLELVGKYDSHPWEDGSEAI